MKQIVSLLVAFAVLVAAPALAEEPAKNAPVPKDSKANVLPGSNTSSAYIPFHRRQDAKASKPLPQQAAKPAAKTAK